MQARRCLWTCLLASPAVLLAHLLYLGSRPGATRVTLRARYSLTVPTEPPNAGGDGGSLHDKQIPVEAGDEHEIEEVEGSARDEHTTVEVGGEQDIGNEGQGEQKCPYIELPGKPAEHELEDEILKPPDVAALQDDTVFPHEGCPLVYVYRDLPEEWVFQDVFSIATEDVFAKPRDKAKHGVLALGMDLHAEPHLAFRKASKLDAMRALYLRLRPGHPCYTEDPRRADLFLIPIFVLRMHRYEVHVNRGMVERKCQGKTEELLKSLKYLTWETAHKHIIGMGVMSVQFLLNVCWPTKLAGVPSTHALLRAVPQLAVTTLFPKHLDLASIFGELHQLHDWICAHPPCNIVPPMPTIPPFTWNETLERSTTQRPWVPSNHERDIFLLYFHASQRGDVAAKKVADEICSAHQAAREEGYEKRVPGFKFGMVCDAGMQRKSLLRLRARYCLELVEPTAGSSLYMSADYAAGCIPVFIGELLGVLYPEYWRGWHSDAFIVLNRKLFVEQKLDPVKALVKVPDSKRLAIEENMAKYGSRFMWFEEDVKSLEDAFAPTLRSAWRHSLQLHRSKSCPVDSTLAPGVQVTTSTPRKIKFPQTPMELISSRANSSMCPYLEWSGWHSPAIMPEGIFWPPPVLPALQHEVPLPHAGCPLVYIYRNLPKKWTILDVSDLTLSNVFGSTSRTGAAEGAPGLRMSIDQHDGMRALHFRVLNSKRCYTEDPERADLFFIPMFLTGHIRTEDSLWGEARRACSGNSAELVSALKYLNWDTVHKHIIGIGRMSMVWFQDLCVPDIDHGGPEIKSPSQALVRSIPLLAQERLWTEDMKLEFPEFNLFKFIKRRWSCNGKRCNNVHAMPYIPSFTWSTTLERQAAASHSGVNRTWVPWNRKRDIFLLYMGSNIPHGDKAARVIIKRNCLLNDAEKFQGVERRVPGFAEAFVCDLNWKPQQSLLKLRARYCLEAGGDTAGRKSIADDYAAGCIPVLLGDGMGVVYPEFWRGWHEDAFLVLNRELYLQERLDLLEVLQQVSEEKRHRIEQNMAAYGQRFMTFEEDVEGLEDAFDVTLRSTWRYSVDLGRRKGNCPEDVVAEGPQ